MPLLRRRLQIIGQDLPDDRDERVQLGPNRRLRPPIARRHREAAHLLLDRPGILAKPPRRLPVAHPFDHHRAAYRQISIHSVHPSTLATQRTKGLPVTEFYSAL